MSVVTHPTLRHEELHPVLQDEVISQDGCGTVLTYEEHMLKFVIAQ